MQNGFIRSLPEDKSPRPAVNHSPSRPMKLFEKLVQRKAQRGKSTTGRLALLSAILLWFVAAGAGLSFLSSYENAPSIAAPPPIRWPTGRRIKRASHRP